MRDDFPRPLWERGYHSSPRQRRQKELGFFVFKLINLFICLCRVLVAAHGLFFAACRLLSSCGVWAPEHVGSVVALRHVGS